MAHSTVTSPGTLDLFSSDEETFLALRRLSSGGPLPENVCDFNPYLCKPENLPDEVWYYVEGNLNANSSFGHWKLKGGDCKLYSNSSFTGWRTTYEYYEGQAPHERKTAWVLQKYWMSQTDLCENGKQKETSSLCKVFVGDEQFQNHEKIQKIEFSNVINSEAINKNHQMVVPDGLNSMANGSTSKSEMIEDDQMLELAVAGKPLDHHLGVILPEMDYFSGGDYLELLDLDNPTSPSSSSESSSCLTMSSDDDFDMMAVLCDAERDINHDRAQRDAACIRSSAPSRLKKEVVHQGASESLVRIRTHSPAKERIKMDSTVSSTECRKPDLKLPIQSEKKVYRLEDAPSSSSSRSSHNKKMVSSGQETVVDGGKKKKKKTVGRMKKMQKKYLCFFPF